MGLICLLDSISGEGDIVVLDAPHILEDGFLNFAGDVDVVLLVLDPELTNRDEASDAVARIKEATTSEIAIVMNRSEFR